MAETLLYWLSVGISILMLLMLVAIHELGHFLACRMVGVRVVRVSLGIGKRVFGWRSARSGTDYCVSLIPFGGFVKMCQPDDPVCALECRGVTYDEAHPRKKLIVMAAGPIASIGAAVVLFWAAMWMGTTGTEPIVDTPVLGRAAAVAGMQAGDRILAINGQAVSTWQTFRLSAMRAALAGKPSQLIVRRGEESLRVVLPTQNAPVTPAGLGTYMGIKPSPDHTALVHVHHDAASALGRAVDQAFVVCSLALRTFEAMLSGRSSIDGFSPALIITAVVGSISANPWQSLLLLVALLSVNIGLVNLLPFPFLDGGRMLFALAEWRNGRPVQESTRHLVFKVSMGVLILAGVDILAGGLFW